MAATISRFVIFAISMIVLCWLSFRMMIFFIKYIFLGTFKIFNAIFFFGNVEIQDGCVRKCVQLHIIISHGYSYSSSTYQCVMLVYILNIFALNPRKGLIQYSKGLRMYITIPSSIRLVIIIIMTKRRPKSAIQPHIHFYLQRIYSGIIFGIAPGAIIY